MWPIAGETCEELMLLPSIKPIAMKERVSMIFIEKGQIDVLDGAFVVIDK